MKPINFLLLSLLILTLAGFCYLGYTIYPKINKQPEINSDTILIHDTLIHVFPGDLQLIPSDTIYHTDTLYHNIDTAAILADYFKEYKYEWIKSDTNIIINGSTSVTENRIKSNQISYRWLQPIQIINNSIDNRKYYSTYLSFGLDIPFNRLKSTQIESILTIKKGYIGVGFTPYNQSFSLKIGLNAIWARGRGVSK